MDFNVNLNNYQNINNVPEGHNQKEDIETEEFLFQTSDGKSSFSDLVDEIGLDGRIGHFRQGKHTGDCWLLSGVYSLSLSEKGQKIIDNAITENEDGTYTVNFKGIKKAFTYTPEDIKAARISGDYSRGDNDMILLEMAFEDIIGQIQTGEVEIKGGYFPHLTIDGEVGSEEEPLRGGSFQDVIYLLTGKNSYMTDVPATGYDPILNKLQNHPGTVALVISFGAGNGNEGETINDIDGNPVFTIPDEQSHAFSIKSVDGDNVTIVNPHDSSKEHVISRDTLKQFGLHLDFYIY